MGPIPALPSSTAFTPLHPLTPTATDPQARPLPSETRPVGLPSDQVLPVTDEAQSRLDQDVVRKRQERAPEEAHGEEAERDPLTVEGPEIESHSTSVTYTVHPDLQRALQGNVIDVNTDEVLRAIPSEERIQFSKAFREQIGTFLDTTA